MAARKRKKKVSYLGFLQARVRRLENLAGIKSASETSERAILNAIGVPLPHKRGRRRNAKGHFIKE